MRGADGRADTPFGGSGRGLGESPWNRLPEGLEDGGRNGHGHDAVSDGGPGCVVGGAVPWGRGECGKTAQRQDPPGQRLAAEGSDASRLGARLTQGSYYQAFYHRLAPRQGKKRAIVAVAHGLLVTGYMLPVSGKKYEDLGVDYFDRLDRERLTRRLVKRLEKLGHKVCLEPAA